MENLQRKIFLLTILIGILLLSNNAKIISARYVFFTTPPTNEHTPTCMKLGCNNLSPSLLHSFYHKTSWNPIYHGSLQRNNAYHIARQVPQGPNPIHNG
jgi:hypothetical protein